MATPRTQHSPSEETDAQRLEAALDMHEFGVQVMRQNLRRRHPDLSEAQIDQLLGDWLTRADEWSDGRFRRRV